MMLEIKIKPFSELSTMEFYQISKLRIDVFVVEQQCPYHELDDHDIDDTTQHVMIYKEQQLIAYARCLKPTATFSGAAIGRVVVSDTARGQGIANILMNKAIEQVHLRWPQSELYISAQSYLLTFYTHLGFELCSEPYLEDGIAHQDMKLKKR